MSKALGRPLVLAAASGAGKSTLAARMLQALPDLALSISYTTRAPRGAEKNGVEYHFVDDKTFREMISKNQFIEWAEVHSHLYGSGLQVTKARLEAGADLLFDIDVQGAEQIKKHFPQAELIWIDAPSWKELERRLRGRGTDSPEVIAERLKNARGERERALDSFDHIILNDDLEEAVKKLLMIAGG